MNNQLTTLLVNKFQILPIELGVAGSISPRLLCASDTGIDPPSLLELYIDPDDTTTSDASSCPFDDDDAAAAANTTTVVYDHQPHQHPHHHHYQHVLVLLKTLDYCTSQGTIVLHQPRTITRCKDCNRSTRG